MLVAQVAVLLQRLVNELLQPWRHLWIQTHSGNGLAVQNGIIDFSRRIAAERKLSRRHLIQHYAEREEICSGIQLLASRLLGRHVRDGSQSYARASQLLIQRSS